MRVQVQSQPNTKATKTEVAGPRILLFPLRCDSKPCYRTVVSFLTWEATMKSSPRGPGLFEDMMWPYSV